MVSLFLAASLVLVPLLGLLIAPFAQIPVARYLAMGRRSIHVWGWVAGVLILASLAAPQLSAISVPLLIVYLLIVILPVVMVELWDRLGWQEGRWVALSTLAAAVTTLVVVSALSGNAGPVEGIAVHLHSLEVQMVDFYQASGVPERTIDEIMMSMDVFEQVFVWFLPSFMVLYFVASIFFLRRRLPALGMRVAVAAFEQFRSEEWLPVGFAATGLATLLLDGTLKWIATNLLASVLILFFVQGLAIIRAHLARWFGRGWHVRWAAAVLCLPVPLPLTTIPVPALVAVLGVADSFYPLRPRADEEENNESNTE